MTVDRTTTDQPALVDDQEFVSPALLYIHPDEPLGQRLIVYKKQIDKEETISIARQKELIIAFRTGTPDAADELIEAHDGLIAALGYRYLTVAQGNAEDLMLVGESALIDAVMQYDMRDTQTFSNFAAIIIDAAFQKAFYTTHSANFANKQQAQPMLEVYRFMANVHAVQDTPQPTTAEGPVDLGRSEILHREFYWLQYLPLTNAEIKSGARISIDTFYSNITRLCDQLGITSRSSLALACLEAGLSFSTPPIPNPEGFTRRERAIISLVHLPYDDIAEQVGTTTHIVNDIVSRMKKRLGARSRTEVAIMAKLGNFAPPPDMTPEYMKQFTEFQRQLIPYLHLEAGEKIMEATGLPLYSVNGAIKNMTEKLGVKRRWQLALYLQEQGFEFDLTIPPKPLNELFSAERIDLFRNLDMSDQMLTEHAGIDAHRLGYDIKVGKERTGARNRTELLLIARKFGSGEFVPAPVREPKLVRLAQKLGVAALNHERLDELMERLGSRERTLIRDYYFSDESVSWRHVADEHGFARTLSIATASNGVKRLKRMLDASEAA